ncbi:MAG: hypothetical protein B6226_03640 [Candidatus Cloacimonetes bacterium 4572_65]|nr:MAG: hypothetical protein B6226_03640 [Candidatus Cloacimonetes bacterium 4572_65]
MSNNFTEEELLIIKDIESIKEEALSLAKLLCLTKYEIGRKLLETNCNRFMSLADVKRYFGED